MFGLLAKDCGMQDAISLSGFRDGLVGFWEDGRTDRWCLEQTTAPLRETITGWEMLLPDDGQGVYNMVRMGRNGEALVAWMPATNETLSLLEGQLDIVADGPRNVPKDASTLWGLMQRWCPRLRLRQGVTQQEVLRSLQMAIDDRLRAAKPILQLNITWFDVRYNWWCECVPRADYERVQVI